MVDWEDVVAIAAGPDTMLALRKDGRVLAPGYQSKSPVSSWRDVVQLSAGESAMLGLRRDGTVVVADCAAYWEFFDDVECLDMSGWTDIKQVCAGNALTVALRTDGWVLIVISNGRFEGLRVESPLEAVAISINRHYEGNDEVLALDIHGHAVRKLFFYEELPWDNWDEE